MKKFIRSSWDSEEEEGIYSDEFRSAMIDDGEIDSWEAAFMKGYDEAG